MKIVIISASTRVGSETLKVAQYVLAQYGAQKVEAEILDLHEHKLPLYDDSPAGPWQDTWKPMAEILQSADGYVFVAPEWNGSMGPGLINMMLYANDELAHKPVMMIGVSSGRGGTYPLVDMRLMGYKNRHYVIIPDNAIIQHVKEALLDGQIVDKIARDRVEYGMEVLLKYAHALRSVRDSGIINLKKFGRGV